MSRTSPEHEIARFLRRVEWCAVIVGVGWLLCMLSPTLTPFALALFLAWLGNPFATAIERLGRSRSMSVCVVFALMTLLFAVALMVFVPVIERQVATLITVLPQGREWIVGTAIPWVEQKTGLELVLWLDPDRLIQWGRAHWQQAGGVAKTLINYISRSGFAMITWGIDLALLPVLTFYFMRDWEKIVDSLAAIIPRSRITLVTQLATQANDAMGALIRCQFMVMVCLGTVYALGLTIVGLKLGILIGFIAGLISFIPYLGAATGIVLALMASILQARGLDVRLLSLVGIVFAVGQLLESYVLTPRIVGDKIGLHPVTVIFAVMAGGELFGFLGMLLALPVSAVANVLLGYVYDAYRQSNLYRHIQSTIEMQRQRDRHRQDADERHNGAAKS